MTPTFDFSIFSSSLVTFFTTTMRIMTITKTTKVARLFVYVQRSLRPMSEWLSV